MAAINTGKDFVSLTAYDAFKAKGLPKTEYMLENIINSGLYNMITDDLSKFFDTWMTVVPNSMLRNEIRKFIVMCVQQYFIGMMVSGTPVIKEVAIRQLVAQIIRFGVDKVI